MPILAETKQLFSNLFGYEPDVPDTPMVPEGQPNIPEPQNKKQLFASIFGYEPDIPEEVEEIQPIERPAIAPVSEERFLPAAQAAPASSLIIPTDPQLQEKQEYLEAMRKPAEEFKKEIPPEAPLEETGAAPPSTTYVPTDPLLQEKYETMAQRESAIEAGGKEALLAATYSKSPVSEARMKEHPVASTIGTVAGTLVPMIAGGMGITKTAMSVPAVAKVAASGPVGKVVTSAVIRMATGAINNLARNNEALFSEDPEVRNNAVKDLAIDMAAFAASPLPETFLPKGMIQPFAQAAADAVVMSTGQLAVGRDPLSKENLTNTIISAIASGVFGLADVKKAPKGVVKNLKEISKGKEWTIKPEVAEAIDKSVKESVYKTQTPPRAKVFEEPQTPQFRPATAEETAHFPKGIEEATVNIREPFEETVARPEEKGYNIEKRGTYERESIEEPYTARQPGERRAATLPGDEGPGPGGAYPGEAESRTASEIYAERKRELAQEYNVKPEVIDRLDEIIKESIYKSDKPIRSRIVEETTTPQFRQEGEAVVHVRKPYEEGELTLPKDLAPERESRLSAVSPENIEAAIAAEKTSQAAAKPEPETPIEKLPKRKKGFFSETGALGEKKQTQPEFGNTREDELAKSAWEKFDRNDEAVRQKFVPKMKQRIRDAVDFYGAGLIDREYYAKRVLSKTPEGDQAVAKLNASRGSSAESKVQYDDAEKNISEYLPHDIEKTFSRYLPAKRIIELETTKGEGILKHAEGMTGEEAQAIVNKVETALPKEKSEAIKVCSQRYWDEMGKPIKRLKDEGLLTEDEYNVLIEQGKNYSMRKFIQHIDPDRVSVNRKGNRVSVSDSGLERIDTGSEEAMINNWRLLLAETIARTESRIFKNRASKELYNFVKAHPENEIDLREEIPLQRKVSLDDARAIAEELQGAKVKLEQRLKKPISDEQRLRIVKKMGDLEEKIDDLTIDREMSEVDTDVEITELQKRALDLNNELRKSETTNEYNFYQNKIAAINNKIERLSRYPKSKEIGDQIKKLQSSKEALTEKMKEPLTGTQIFNIENKIQTLSNRIDKWAGLIDDADSKGLEEITFNSKQYSAIPAGYERISTMIDGEKRSMLAPTKFAVSWNSSDHAIGSSLSKALNKYSGSFIVRPLATGALAPEFAFSNIPRDAAMQWLVTKEYNPVAPIALFQVGRNFFRVAKDAWTGEGRYRDYIRQGGGMEFLYEQGAMFRDPTRPVTVNTERGRHIKEAMTKIQEFSERLGRLALREQALLNGKTPEEATRIAREYLDFAQGGSWTKAVDNAIPYLNASVQGTRSLVKALRKDKGLTSAKAVQLMIMGAGLAYTANKFNPKATEKITDREKVTRWNFPLPFKTADGNGTYFSIPKDQSARLFATIGEVSAELAMGKISGNTAWRKVKMAFGDINPIDIIGFVPPTMAAIIGYSLNKDFWMRDDIWKGRKVSPHMEFYEGYTPKALVDFASQLSKVGIEVSPARLESALGQVMPKNPVTALMGGMYEQVTAGLPDKERQQLDKTVVDYLTSVPGSRKYFRKTYPDRIDVEELVKGMKKYGISRFDKKGRPKTKRMLQEEVDEMEMKVGDIRQMNDNEAKIISQLFMAGSQGEAAEKWEELRNSAGKVLGSDEVKRLNRRLKVLAKKKK